MFDLLALITKKKYWYIHSIIIKVILKMYGIKIGKKFYIEGLPKLKIKGNPKDIIIGNNVSVFGDIDIRNRENGKIIIEDEVTIDNDCRFVSANNAVLRISKRTYMGPYCFIVSGVDISIGEDCLIAGMAHIQSSEHGYRKGESVRKQKHVYGQIVIGNEVWIAGNVTIMKGAVIGSGCIIGAKSLVRNGHYEKNTVLAGIPAKKIKDRL
jgi:acetyltransferase-like isoleucine patch superfamily enzyme